MTWHVFWIVPTISLVGWELQARERRKVQAEMYTGLTSVQPELLATVQTGDLILREDDLVTLSLPGAIWKRVCNALTGVPIDGCGVVVKDEEPLVVWNDLARQPLRAALGQETVASLWIRRLRASPATRRRIAAAAQAYEPEDLLDQFKLLLQRREDTSVEDELDAIRQRQDLRSGLAELASLVAAASDAYLADPSPPLQRSLCQLLEALEVHAVEADGFEVTQPQMEPRLLPFLEVYSAAGMPRGVALRHLFSIEQLGGAPGEMRSQVRDQSGDVAGTFLLPAVALREGIKDHFFNEAWTKVKPGAL